MARWAVLAVSVAVAGFVVSGCATGPATRSDVCAEFDALGEKITNANGIIDNPVFSKAGDLADAAGRYDGSPSLSGDADALDHIADASLTSGGELMAATPHIAELCGHPLGFGSTIQDTGGDATEADSGAESGDESGGEAEVEPGLPAGAFVPTLGEPTDPAPPAADEKSVTGPGGLTISIPAGWVVGGSPAAANQQAADPAEPDCFLRFGAATPPAVSLLAEIRTGERSNPNVRNGYRRIRLAQTTFLGVAAVDWEFTFVKDGTTRHALGRYWRDNGLGYVVYLSTPAGRWAGVRPVFDRMADTAAVR